MHERLLDKTISPSFDDLISYSGERGALWLELDKHLKDNFSAKQNIRFPYGNSYGWSSQYTVKGKHICDTFAEKGAFALHFRISNEQLDSVYNDLSDYAKKICDNKYPCKDGGWLTYRILTKSQMKDAVKILSAKING